MMKSMLTLTAAILIAAPAAHAELPAATVKKIDDAFAGSGDGPGCSVGVYDQGKPIFAKGYGFANLEHRIPNTADTVFDIASMSKQFTAMSVILLAKDGKLGLDEDVRKYLPELRDYGTAITVRQLLNHTSGIRDFINLFFLKGLNEKDYYTAPEIYEILGRQRALAFAPGSAFSYSNSGYFLLGEIVERVAGQSLAKFAQERIFTPLGMKNTHFHDNSSLVVPRRAYGYYGDKGAGFTVGGGFLDFVGDGGVFTTVGDLQLWDEDFYRGKIWRPEVKEEMLRVNTLTDGKPVRASEVEGYYASGIEIGKWRGLPVVRHAGSWVGYVSDFVRFPEQHFSVAVLCNVDSMSPTELTGRIADVFLEKFYTEPAPKHADADAAAASKLMPMPADLMAALPGTYYSADLDTRYVIEPANGTLAFKIGVRQAPFNFSDYGSPLSFLGDDTIGNENARFKLHRGAAGKVTSLVLEASRTDGLAFERVAGVN